jgi:hypothetical protein
MIRHIPKILVLNLFAILTTVTVGAQTPPPETFHYAVRIPVTAQTCQQEATALGARFATTKGVTVNSATCSGIIPITADKANYNLYSLLVTYQGKRVYPSTAIIGASSLSTTPGDGPGIYDTYASCVADIPAQTTNFAAATSLTTLDAFCTAVGDMGGFKYKLQMDGVGTKTNSLYVFDPKLSGNVDPQLQTGLQNLVATSGGAITKVVGNQIFYYAKYALDLYTGMLGIFHNADECQSQVADAAAMLTNAGAKNIIVRCLNDGMNIRVASTYYLDVIHDGPSSVVEDYGYNNRFYSFNECMGEKPRIVQDGGKNTLGGICQPAMDLSTNYVLDLFTHY